MNKKYCTKPLVLNESLSATMSEKKTFLFDFKYTYFYRDVQLCENNYVVVQLCETEYLCIKDGPQYS